MKPPPPMPQLNGSVTPRVAAAATAASIALPPWFRIASAALEAGSLMVATAPPLPVATGVLENAAPGKTSATMREETRTVRAGRGLAVMWALVGIEVELRGVLHGYSVLLTLKLTR